MGSEIGADDGNEVGGGLGACVGAFVALANPDVGDAVGYSHRDELEASEAEPDSFKRPPA